MSTAPRQPSPVPPVPAADPKREYVGSGDQRLLGRDGMRSLPHAFDDLTTDFGDNLYDQMRFDPQIAASMVIFKAGVLEDGAQVGCALTDKDADGYDQAAKLVPFCEQALENMETALDDVLWDLLDAPAVGNRVAENVYHLDRTYTGRQQLVLRAIKVKPRKATAFVVDSYMNVRGLLGQLPEQPLPVQSGAILSANNAPPNLLPRQKFTVLSFRPRNNDPRGTSILRPAYNAWWLKMQTWQEYLRYLAQFASGSIVGTTAEHAEPEYVRNADGQLIVGTDGLPLQRSPELKMLEALQQLRNGGAAAFPYGSEVKALTVPGEGKAFLDAIALYNREMVLAILHQTLTTGEGEHGTNALGSVHQDVLDTLLRQAKRAVQRALRYDVLRRLVAYNFAPNLVPLTPLALLGTTEQQDRAPMIAAIGQLARTYPIDPSQLPGIDALLGLPPRMVTTDAPANKGQDSGQQDDQPTDQGDQES